MPSVLRVNRIGRGSGSQPGTIKATFEGEDEGVKSMWTLDAETGLVERREQMNRQGDTMEIMAVEGLSVQNQGPQSGAAQVRWYKVTKAEKAINDLQAAGAPEELVSAAQKKLEK